MLDNINDVIKVYQDGKLIGKEVFYKKIRSYDNEKYFYLGVGNPKRNDPPNSQYPNYFNGYISTFAVYNCNLNDNEILEISKNENNTFKSKYTFEKRLAESTRIMHKYPTRIPIIVYNNNN